MYKGSIIRNNNIYNLLYFEKHYICIISENNTMKKIKLNFLFCTMDCNYVSISPLVSMYQHNILNYFSTSFMKMFVLFLQKGMFKFFNKFELRGFAYKIKTDNNLLVFKLGYSHLVYHNLNLNVMYAGIGKRYKDNTNYRLTSFNNNFLGDELAMIGSYRQINIYSGYGIRTQNKQLILKKGKVSMF